mgnify:CR=1 FL=1
MGTLEESLLKAYQETYKKTMELNGRLVSLRDIIDDVENVLNGKYSKKASQITIENFSTTIKTFIESSIYREKSLTILEILVDSYKDKSDSLPDKIKIAIENREESRKIIDKHITLISRCTSYLLKNYKPTNDI